MINNNLIRSVDSSGRLLIPKRIRDIFRLEASRVEIFSENDLICIRRFEGFQKITKTGTSGCNRCLCESCSGFGCPWVYKSWRYDLNQHRERCFICMTRNIGLIHDCDFYKSRRRVKFYLKKPYEFPETKADIIIRELGELRALIRVNPE